jgi:hypothetical protein
MDLFTPYIIWNIIVTLVLGPLWLSIRKNETELKRQDILLNKTREELAKGYVTKPELKNEMDVVIDRFDKLEEKIDKIYELIYNK